jgi:hypothetical protein
MSYIVIAKGPKIARALARGNITLTDALFGATAVLCLFAAVFIAIAFDRLFICRSRAVIEETSKPILAFEDEVTCQKLGMNSPRWHKYKGNGRFFCQKNGEEVEVERKP